MKAVVIDRFGGPDEMKVRDVTTPEPTDHEIQIRVSHASVNPVDWKIREGYLQNFLPHEFPIVLGWDCSGVVSSVGAQVKDFKVGDSVYTYARKPIVNAGTYAEYLCVEAKHAAKKPTNLSYAEAASIPLTTLTAWQSLFETAHLHPGEKIMILGGAGGVGGMGIQLAKDAGAQVFTTASFKNHGYVRELGAETVIDYSDPVAVSDWRRGIGEGVDVVFDCVGGETLKQAVGWLKKGGRLVSIVDRPDLALCEEHGVSGSYVFVAPRGDQLAEIAQLFEQGKLMAPAIEEMRLEDAAAAHLKNQTRHQRGKIVLRVS